MWSLSLSGTHLYSHQKIWSENYHRTREHFQRLNAWSKAFRIKKSVQQTPHIEHCCTISICIAMWKQTVIDGQRERERLRVWRVLCQTTFQRQTETLRLSLHHCGSSSASYHGNTGLHGGPERWWRWGERDRRKRERGREWGTKYVTAARHPEAYKDRTSWHRVTRNVQLTLPLLFSTLEKQYGLCRMLRVFLPVPHTCFMTKTSFNVNAEMYEDSRSCVQGQGAWISHLSTLQLGHHTEP